MKRLTATSFQSEAIHNTMPVLVIFYAKWCAKCAMMKAVVEEMEEKYGERMVFCEVDIEESPLLAAQYETDIVPTFVLFRNGQVAGRMQGIIEERVFEQRVKKIFRNT